MSICRFLVLSYVPEERDELRRLLLSIEGEERYVDCITPEARKIRKYGKKAGMPQAVLFMDMGSKLRSLFGRKTRVFEKTFYETMEEYAYRVLDAMEICYVKPDEEKLEHLQRIYNNGIDETQNLTEAEIRENLLAMAQKEYRFSHRDAVNVASELYSNNRGYGVLLDRLMKDPSITEVMINGDGSVYTEKNGSKSRIDAGLSDEEINQIAEKFVDYGKARLDEVSPISDIILPDRSRVCIVKSGLSSTGTCITIRKFPEHSYSLEELVSFGSLSEEAAEYLRALVRSRYNIVIAGGTDSGKTTLLNSLIASIPEDQRIITAEDTREIRIPAHYNALHLVTRKANSEGVGEINLRKVIMTTLRMCPDRLIVGEVRGAETFDMIEAMNTGHAGSMTTVHANSCRDAIPRLENMILSERSMDMRAVRGNISQAIDIIVHATHLPNGARVVTEIAEVGRMDDQARVEIRPLYQRDAESGELRRCSGNRLERTDKVLQYGDPQARELLIPARQLQRRRKSA